MKYFYLLLVALLAAGSAAHAQTRRSKKTVPAPTTSSDTAAWPIETLSVEGSRNYTADQILSIAGLKVGQKAGKTDFEAARQRLVATGAFDTVGYRYTPAKDGKGYDAVFEISDLRQLYPLRFEGLPVSDAQLRAWLKEKDPLFGDKIPATKPEVDRYVKLLSEYLVGHGYTEPVTGKVTSDSTSDLVVVFRPDKPLPSIARVKFTNTGDVPADALQGAMYGVAVGTLYTEPSLRQLLDTTARALYEAKGMIRVSFTKIETAPAKDVDGIDVTVDVKPGPVYKLGHVTFFGSESSQKELAKLANLKSNEPVNFDQVKAAQERIAEDLHHGGYLNASSQVKRNINDTDHVVDLRFEIAPGPLFTMGKLDIVGLDIETEPVIRKMWGLGPGKPFNPNYPDHFLKVVTDSGVFDNLKKTHSDTKIVASNHTVNVTLYFNK